MNMEIKQFCESNLIREPKKKLKPEEREKMVKEIILRKPQTIEPQPIIPSNFGDPLDFIPNFRLSLDSTLVTIPNPVNKVLLKLVWNSLPYFRENHNLLLKKSSTFIRYVNNPKGLIVHMHYDCLNGIDQIRGYQLFDNPFVQEVKEISETFPKYHNKNFKYFK